MLKMLESCNIYTYTRTYIRPIVSKFVVPFKGFFIFLSLSYPPGSFLAFLPAEMSPRITSALQRKDVVVVTKEKEES